MDTNAGRLGVSGGFRCGPPHSHPYPPTPSFNDGRLAAPDRLRARRAVASGVEWRREGSSAVASVHCLPSQQPFRAPLLLLWRRPPAVLSGSAGGPLALPPPYPLIRDSTPLGRATIDWLSACLQPHVVDALMVFDGMPEQH
jgi:hypothetical protein